MFHNIVNNNRISVSKVLGETNHMTRDVAYEYIGVQQTPVMYIFDDDFSLGIVE